MASSVLSSASEVPVTSSSVAAAAATPEVMDTTAAAAEKSPPEEDELPPDSLNGEDEYLVENIVEKKCDPADGVWKYFIKWKGWPSETNTWEPIANLTGCEELLSEFEKRWAKEHENDDEDTGTPRRKSAVGSARKRKAAGAAATGSHPKEAQDGDDEVNNDDDDRENESNFDSDLNDEHSKKKAKNYMEFDILDTLPDDKEPAKLLGVVNLQGILTYLIEWKTADNQAQAEANSDRSLVRSTTFQLKYPQIVIAYYEKHISFLKQPTTQALLRERANRALAAAAAARSRSRSRSLDSQLLDGDDADDDDDFNNENVNPLSYFLNSSSSDTVLSDSPLEEEPRPEPQGASL